MIDKPDTDYINRYLCNTEGEINEV